VWAKRGGGGVGTPGFNISNINCAFIPLPFAPVHACTPRAPTLSGLQCKILGETLNTVVQTLVAGSFTSFMPWQIFWLW
jgi:hypothetical protein